MADTFNLVVSETRALTVEEVAKKSHKVSRRERNFLFNYIKEGDIPEHMRSVANDPEQNLKIHDPIEEYKTNVFVIIEAFFKHGFIPEILQ